MMRTAYYRTFARNSTEGAWPKMIFIISQLVRGEMCGKTVSRRARTTTFGIARSAPPDNALDLGSNRNGARALGAQLIDRNLERIFSLIGVRRSDEKTATNEYDPCRANGKNKFDLVSVALIMQMNRKEMDGHHKSYKCNGMSTFTYI